MSLSTNFTIPRPVLAISADEAYFMNEHGFVAEFNMFAAKPWDRESELEADWMADAAEEEQIMWPKIWAKMRKSSYSKRV